MSSTEVCKDTVVHSQQFLEQLSLTIVAMRLLSMLRRCAGKMQAVVKQTPKLRVAALGVAVAAPALSMGTSCDAKQQVITEEQQIDAYVEELLDDDHLYHTAIFGYSRPLAVEAVIFKALVKQVVQLFKGTVGLENKDPAEVFG